jgi:hypothetical protein
MIYFIIPSYHCICFLSWLPQKLDCSAQQVSDIDKRIFLLENTGLFPYIHKNPDCDASYNEVRIWKKYWPRTVCIPCIYGGFNCPFIKKYISVFARSTGSVYYVFHAYTRNPNSVYDKNTRSVFHAYTDQYSRPVYSRYTENTNPVHLWNTRLYIWRIYRYTG